MCSRRGLQYEENNAIANIENIVNDIKITVDKKIYLNIILMDI